MKLAALYTIFNGLELLEGSIAQIASEVDLIVIGYQTISNTGIESKEVQTFVRRFENSPKIKLVKFKPDLKLNTKENERRKHQKMLNAAKKEGCTHFILSACDHYYVKEDFRKAKEAVKTSDVDVSFSYMATYYKKANWRLFPSENYCMPFICKIQDSTRFISAVNYPVVTDPSVRVAPFKTSLVFPANELIMHHFSMLRIDVESKFRNAASSVNWSEEKIQGFIREFNNARPGMPVKYFQGRKIYEVKNLFNL